MVANFGAALRALAPGKLLPDRQPAYVASWVYVFGVASLAAIDTDLLAQRQFYGTDFTKSLLFLADGARDEAGEQNPGG